MDIKTNNSTRHFTHSEMLDRLGRFLEKEFTTADFTEHYESFCNGGKYEDQGIASDLRDEYPSLCAGQFNSAEWEAFVADTFWDLYDCDILIPDFPRD